MLGLVITCSFWNGRRGGGSKKTGSDEYETLNKIERVYMNMLVIQLDETRYRKR